MHTPHQLSDIVCEHNPCMPPNTLSPRFFPISLISVGNECSVLWGLPEEVILRTSFSSPSLHRLNAQGSAEGAAVIWKGNYLLWFLPKEMESENPNEEERWSVWGGEKKNASFLLQPVNRLMGAGAGMSWYLSAQREREIRIEWLFDGFLTASFSLAPFLDMCAFICLFISSAVVNSFLGRETILPNGQVSIRWVRTLIARLMSWQERWVLSFDNSLIIKLPQERMLMRGRTKRWDESTFWWLSNMWSLHYP